MLPRHPFPTVSHSSRSVAVSTGHLFNSITFVTICNLFRLAPFQRYQLLLSVAYFTWPLSSGVTFITLCSLIHVTSFQWCHIWHVLWRISRDPFAVVSFVTFCSLLHATHFQQYHVCLVLWPISRDIFPTVSPLTLSVAYLTWRLCNSITFITLCSLFHVTRFQRYHIWHVLSPISRDPFSTRSHLTRSLVYFTIRSGQCSRQVISEYYLVHASLFPTLSHLSLL